MRIVSAPLEVLKSLSLPRGDWLLITAGSLLLVLAYPPFHLFVPSFTCLIPAVLLIVAAESDARPLRRQLAQGFWFGMFSNALVLYWIVVALWHFTPLSGLAYAASIGVLGLYGAALFGLVGWLRRSTRFSILLIFPICWTAKEWIIGHQGDVRFPWLGLGSSLTHFPAVVQIAEVVGARGVTLLLAMANVALALALLSREDRRRSLSLVGSVAAGVLLAAAYGTVRMHTLAVRNVGTVALIQPNVGVDEKWDRSQQDSIVSSLVDLSEEAVSETGPDLVIWPEVAIPYYFIYRPDWEQLVAAHVVRTGVPAVVGGLDVTFYDSGDSDYYNSAFLFDSTGNKDAQRPYHKQYLVPIVERVPFVNPRWFKSLTWFGGFGKGESGPVYSVKIGRFGLLICYESAFEDLSRDYRNRGADFLVNITNDAWFGNTSAPYQHAAHLVMRAIENRVGIARAANTGITEFVDPLGRERDRTRLGTRTFVTGQLTTSDVTTVYTRLGDWVGLLSVVSALGLVLYARLHKP